MFDRICYVVRILALLLFPGVISYKVGVALVSLGLPTIQAAIVAFLTGLGFLLIMCFLVECIVSFIVREQFKPF